MTNGPFSDPFDALRAHDTSVAPPDHVTARIRQLLADELERLVTRPPTSAVPADLTVVNTVTPYLSVSNAAAAIAFYVDAFGAVEHHRLVDADGRIGHAEIVIGNTRLALADEYPEAGVLAPTTRGGTSTMFTISVPDNEILAAMFARALVLGATELRPIADQFYGHRTGQIMDPFGHQWTLGTPIPGFDDETYRAQSAEVGLDLQRATADPADDAHQVKAHVRGDLYYFTLQVPDLARAQRFYGAVLGWQFAAPDDGHAVNISAPPGGVREAETPAGPDLWFVVDDIHTAVEAVRAAGGTADEPVFYPSGWSAECVDDQGVRFSLSVPTYTR